jgi:hypothetical protein
MLYKPDTLRRLVNQAIELNEFDIEYLPRTAIKRKALADFVVEFANFPKMNVLPTKETWTVHVDRATNKKNG